MHEKEKLSSLFLLSASILSGFVVFVSAVFLALWIFRIPVPSVHVPTPDAALALLLLSICARATLIHPKQTDELSQLTETLFYAVPAIILGAGVFALKAVFPHSSIGANPLLMNPVVAVSVLLIGCALVLLKMKRTAQHYAGQSLILTALVVALFSCVADLYGLTTPGSIARSMVPAATAVPLLALSLSALLAQPDRVLDGMLTHPGLGGKTMRLLFSFGAVLVLGAGWVLILGQHAGLYRPFVMVAMLAVALIVAFGAIILWMGERLNESESAKALAEKNLQKTVTETHEVFRAVHEAIVYADREGRILAWNVRAEKMLGWTEQEILGAPLLETILPPEERQRFKKLLLEYDRRHNTNGFFDRQIQVLLMHRDGHEIPVELSISPIESDGLRCICLVFRDISERLRLSEQLSLARDRAMESSRLKSEFVANISHEIRTPLNAIVGMSDLLHRQELPAQAKEFSEGIHEAAEVLLNIVNDILDYSKIEAGKMDIERTEVDVVALVESATELVAAKARDKGLSLSSFVSPDVPRILRGDPGRIRQVLLNLLTNAIKFTDYGEVVVKATPVTCDDTSVIMRFSVSDTGTGIVESAQGAIFEPFTQADGSATRKYGGTGLGLSISKRLVALMGGQIGLQSALGKGSEFWFTVPLEKPAKRAYIQSTKKVFQDVKLLVIDGPPIAGEIILAYARSWGIRCDEVDTGEEALEALRRAAADKRPYDVAIVDFKLTHSDALALARSVSKYPDLAATRLILVSTFDDPQLAHEAVAAGFSAVLQKPLRQSKLYDCIVNLIAENYRQPGSAPALSAGTDLAPSAPEESEPAAQRGWKATKRILVVEDNAVNQKVATAQLAQLGFTADTASNGREALAAVSSNDYALVLMDCQMPEMDGFEATRALRQRESLTGRHIPVVAMTAHAMSEDKNRCLTAGMDDYISKPVKVEVLKEVIDRYIVSPSSEQESRQLSIELPDGAENVDKTVEFQRLKDRVGSGAAREMLHEFVASAKQLLTRLEAAVEEHNVAEIGEMAHDLQVSSANVSADQFSQTSHELEEASAASDWIHVEECYPKLQLLLERISDALEGQK